MFVREVMTREVLTVGPETPLKDVARLLTERRISGLPVVSGDGAVLGVISEGDFLAKDANLEPPRRPLAWLFGPRARDEATIARLRATTAGEAMSAPPITIGPNRPLSEAARIMAEHTVNRLPVVEDGRLVGIVTRADVVRAYARSDAELLEITRETLHGVDGLRVIAVQDGVAVLAGTVAHQAIAETSRSVVERIDGIVGVDDDRVAWLEPMPEDDELRKSETRVSG
jgi:CBS domain-containing protein